MLGANDFGNDCTVYVGETHVTAAESNGETLVVDSEQVQHVGVKIVDGHFVFDDTISILVRRAVNGSALTSTTRHPQAEPLRVVVSTIALCKGCATEFS